MTIAEPWSDAPLAVALGDPAGIGPEIVVKAWLARKEEGLPPFFAVGDIRSIETIWAGPVERIDSPEQAAGIYGRALPLLSVEVGGEIAAGQPNLEGARCSLDSLEVATGLTRSGAASALVTGPVAKHQLYAIGFTHPGQTEFVAERCGIAPENVVMMLAGPDLRVVPVTTHMPLARVAHSLSIEVIAAKARTTARGLQRSFGIAEPRLAFAGLNPHAGEGGALGTEEIDLIEPAIAELRAEGLDVTGPLAADTMFHARARRTYDADHLEALHDRVEPEPAGVADDGDEGEGGRAEKGEQPQHRPPGLHGRMPDLLEQANKPAGRLGPLDHRLLGRNDLIEKLLMILVEALDPRVVPAGEAMHEPGPDGVDPLHRAQVDARDGAVIALQPLGQCAQPRERKVTAEAQRSVACVLVEIGRCPHRAYLWAKARRRARAAGRAGAMAQPSPTSTAWIRRPTSPPTSVPFTRIYCRSLPTAFSRRRVMVRVSQLWTVSETSRTMPSP